MKDVTIDLTIVCDWCGDRHFTTYTSFHNFLENVVRSKRSIIEYMNEMIPDCRAESVINNGNSHTCDNCVDYRDNPKASAERRKNEG